MYWSPYSTLLCQQNVVRTCPKLRRTDEIWFSLTNGSTHGSFSLGCRIEITLVSYTYSTLLAKLNLFIGHIKLLHVLTNYRVIHTRIVLVHSLVEYYVGKNHSRNWLWFFWPTWYAIAKWLHIFFLILGLQIKTNWAYNIPLGRYFQFSIAFQYYVTCPQIPKILVARPKK